MSDDLVVPASLDSTFAGARAIFAAADGTPDTALFNIFAIDKHRHADLAAARAARSVGNFGRAHPDGWVPLRSDLSGRSPLPPHTLFKQELVNETVRGLMRGEAHPEEIDPVHLFKNQPNVTLGGVSHYVNHPDWWQRGETYADSGQAGNKVPIIYERTSPQHGHRERYILSGHHRAAAALGLGIPLIGRIVHAE